MHRRRSLTVAATLLAMVPAFTFSAQMIGSDSRLTDLMNEAPGVRFYHHEDGKLGLVYGVPLATGRNPLESADRFVARHGALPGFDIGDLVMAPKADGIDPIQPVMFEHDRGTFKFTAINYGQFRRGIPVFRSGLVVLVRNEADYPVVMGNYGLRDLRGFDPGNQVGGMAGDEGNGQVNAQRVTQRMLRNARRVLGFEGQVVGAPQTVIWAGLDGMVVEPAVAVVFSLEFDSGDPATYRKRLFVAHAGTGEILYSESEVHEVTDIVGSVQGNATQGNGADICGPEVPMGMPYARVVLNGQNYFADVNGDFVIPHSGTTEVTLTTEVRGRWFRVFNPNNAPPEQLSMNVVPPGPANFLFNAANATEQLRSEVNTYLHSNIVRDWVVFYNPQYPTIPTQQEFRINVNITQNCNAFYNGSSINFYTSGGSCANTGFSSVVYHEYGHHIVNRSGSGQGAYGEGQSDVVAALLTRDPRLGIGFQNNCNSGIRNAANNCQYQTSGCSSCGSAIHSCGQLISGCVWSTRAYLQQTNPQTYHDIISNLALNSTLLRTPGDTTIRPDITIHYLTLDDDDSNLNNGTPHYDEINQGFSDHNMPGPPLPHLVFEYPDGRPALIDPSQGATIRVRVLPLRSQPQPGTGLLHVDTGGGFQTVPMQEIGNHEYEAIIPGGTCGQRIRYYFTAETTTSQVVSDPLDAPATFFVARVGSALEVVFSDNFQTNQGWTVTNENLTDGAWERGVPVGDGSRGDPRFDFDGSGACYLTANRTGNSDVDGGPTRLISPIIDMSQHCSYRVSYARWFYSQNGVTDRFTVQVSNDGGSTWTTMEDVPHQGTSWIHREFWMHEILPLTNQMRFRFNAVDNPNDSVTEAAVDAFLVEAVIINEPVAELTGFQVLVGSLTSGTLADLVNSDDQRVRTRSGFGSTFTDLHNMTMRVDANSGVPSPSSIDLTIESRISHTSGTAQVRLWNWNASQYNMVGSYAIGQTETPVTIESIPAGNFINGSGDIRLTIKHIVVVPVFAFQFDSFFDQVKLVVD
ncbi:MAG: hypothetical protein HRU76_15455 [Phycisphaeraceae bacterium]|nr:hypothetical protein [Phycisphaerales bacterium]QOJ18899.1 MAG: hypothetical protein HRU76_15455 [Phycisphaeraceae bacterium]